MKSLAKYFHWYYYNKSKHSLINFVIGILYWIYIGLSLPFGVSDLNDTNFFTLIFVLFPFIFIWPIVSYGADGLFRVFRLGEKERLKLSVWFIIIKLVLFVHVIVLARGILCMWTCISLTVYLQVWIESFLLLLTVLVPFAFMAKRSFSRQREMLNKNDLSSLFEFFGPLKKNIRIDLDNICYIKSDDKYVEFYLINNEDDVDKVLFRASLKSIQDQLKDETQFVRIHRSYIINTKYILSYSRENEIEIGVHPNKIILSVSKSYRKNLPLIEF